MQNLDPPLCGVHTLWKTPVLQTKVSFPIRAIIQQYKIKHIYCHHYS